MEPQTDCTGPGSSVPVDLAGPQTIREMEATRDRIASALGRPGDLTLDCTDVTAADVSFVQVLLAAQRSAASAGRSLLLHRPPSGALLETLRRGGFLAADGPPPGRDPPSRDPADWSTPGQTAP